MYCRESKDMSYGINMDESLEIAPRPSLSLEELNSWLRSTTLLVRPVILMCVEQYPWEVSIYMKEDVSKGLLKVSCDAWCQWNGILYGAGCRPFCRHLTTSSDGIHQGVGLMFEKIRSTMGFRPLEAGNIPCLGFPQVWTTCRFLIFWCLNLCISVHRSLFWAGRTKLECSPQSDELQQLQLLNFCYLNLHLLKLSISISNL